MDEFLGTEDAPKAQTDVTKYDPRCLCPFPGGQRSLSTYFVPCNHSCAFNSTQAPLAVWSWAGLGQVGPAHARACWRRGVTALETPGPWGTGG